jgi:hypothetical protein
LIELTASLELGKKKIQLLGDWLRLVHELPQDVGRRGFSLVRKRNQDTLVPDLLPLQVADDNLLVLSRLQLYSRTVVAHSVGVHVERQNLHIKKHFWFLTFNWTTVVDYAEILSIFKAAQYFNS